ncbi:MAG: serine hydrolase, partial [bacterium]|nr:serine hydrolase [bacterium]
RPPKPPFEYSNLGYGLLGQALANRAGVTYPELLRQEVTGPLGMEDTVIALSPEQRARFLTGIDMRDRPNKGWDMDVMAPAGGIRSTASDMLTYLEAQLDPEAAGPLAEALKQSHWIRADVVDGLKIGLGWVYYTDNKTYWHNGGTGGYSSYAFFHPERDFAAIVLVNRSPGIASFADWLGEYVRQRLAGEPAISLDNVMVPP